MSLLFGEPTLDEMLFDPTVITMMKRDGVSPGNLRVLLLEMSRRLKRQRVSPSACENTTPHTGRAWEPHGMTPASAPELKQNRGVRA
jgi:hypothetical protein